MQEPRKVVYLLGAGSTHAEKMFARFGKKHVKDEDLEKEGLINKHVSKRVIGKILKNNKTCSLISKYGIVKKNLEEPYDIKKDVDVEFLITLVESNKTEKSEEMARILRNHFRQDILNKLIIKKRKIKRKIKPQLYSALLEWQKHEKNEKVLGYLTLNYDSLFEEALKNQFYSINYGFTTGETPQKKGGTKTVLKLHGSFDWFLDSNSNEIRIDENIAQQIGPQWIPPGLMKEYSIYPYNLLFGKAREILVKCDTLRVIGCSLSPNDLGLMSLIFDTRLRGGGSYAIEIIDSQETYKSNFQKRLGFMLKLEESFYQKSPFKEERLEITDNAFLDWLISRAENMASRGLRKTKYLKKLKQKVIK